MSRVWTLFALSSALVVGAANLRPEDIVAFVADSHDTVRRQQERADTGHGGAAFSNRLAVFERERLARSDFDHVIFVDHGDLEGVGKQLGGRGAQP